MSSTQGERIITIQASIHDFWRIITDYERYSAMHSEIKKSEVIKDDDEGTDVYFEVSVLLKQFDYTLRFQPSPPDDQGQEAELAWTLVNSTQLEENTGAWKLKALGPTLTEASYAAEVSSKSFIPKSFLNALLKLALPSMLKRWKTVAEKEKA